MSRLRTLAAPLTTRCKLSCKLDLPSSGLPLGSPMLTRKHLRMRLSVLLLFVRFYGYEAHQGRGVRKMKLKSLLLRYYPPGMGFPRLGPGFPFWDGLGRRRGWGLGKGI